MLLFPDELLEQPETTTKHEKQIKNIKLLKNKLIIQNFPIV
jgi:hypothetical protein